MLKDDIGFTASTTSKKIKALVSKSLKAYNVTAEQWTVLKQLSFVSGINQKELSQRTDKDQATLTKILDLLEQNHFIVRLPNPEDRRSFCIQITDEGRRLVEKVIPDIEGLYEKILNHLSKEQLDNFMEVLLQIQQNIKELQE
ncbi:MarR family winged helix-turn-helix transcriptional regulator [Heyndrickxia acidicola]|uniref:MarR family transcriptional regulator n=1 Tax=Heyndrickxia acidicola TaxID=209389 RepID=A0ABU6MBI7_9BACI|nr:MarR family transcriptional regulator [Heyndrickxia acidicola]MED1201875.1 MarR family transcriptional regulator [Heyndrickxia acidicola]